MGLTTSPSRPRRKRSGRRHRRAWDGRLVFDFDVSDTSPVVKGTWIAVAHVVSQIVDGCTWADILRSHPELTEDDIRACVAYAMAEENSAA